MIANVDVLVCGGGPAGVGAAVRAGRMGADVMLIETLDWLGGIATAGMMSHWAGHSSSKIMSEIFERSRQKCEVLGWVQENECADYTINQEVLKIVLDEMANEANGKTDCTEAIQKAFNSGKPAVYFGSGHYLVSDSVSVPATVELIDFMYCDFYADEKLRKMKKCGFLIVEEESVNPLCLQNVFAWEKFYGYFRFVKHASHRTLVMRDLQTQCAGMYFNTAEGGKVFIENVACTMGGNEFGEDYCTVSPFEFVGQKVWCRQINPERGDIQILNDHSDLWILGMKTETHVGRFGSIAVKTVNGGRTECFGARSGIGSSGIPLYIN